MSANPLVRMRPIARGHARPAWREERQRARVVGRQALLAHPTDGVAAAKPDKPDVAPRMFRAFTRPVLFEHTAASSAMNHVADTSDASATSQPPLWPLSG